VGVNIKYLVSTLQGQINLHLFPRTYYTNESELRLQTSSIFYGRIRTVIIRICGERHSKKKTQIITVKSVSTLEQHENKANDFH